MTRMAFVREMGELHRHLRLGAAGPEAKGERQPHHDRNPHTRFHDACLLCA
jgi:hypothetical protein